MWVGDWIMMGSEESHQLSYRGVLIFEMGRAELLDALIETSELLWRMQQNATKTWEIIEPRR